MPCSLCGAPAVAVVDLGATSLAACRGCIGKVLDVKRAMTERVIFTTVPSSSTSFDTSATDARAILYPPTDDTSARMIPPREAHATAHCNRPLQPRVPTARTAPETVTAPTNARRRHHGNHHRSRRIRCRYTRPLAREG